MKEQCSCNCGNVSESLSLRLLRAVTMFTVIALVYISFTELGIFSFSRTFDGAVGLGTAFLAGLVAATSSCLAVVGGVLLSVSATWSESMHNATHWEKFRPQLFFHIGRLGGYFVLGGLVGLIGKSIGLSSYSKGALTVALAVVMIILGLKMLHLLPKRFCRLPLPGSWSDSLRRLGRSRNPVAPLLLGTLTFFLPCGFTQSMQLIALGTGSFMAGGMLMLVFALGTLPALVGISALSSFLEGRASRWFLALSGAFVLLLGLSNIQNGLLLLGYDPVTVVRTSFADSDVETGTSAQDKFVSIDAEGRQIISMYVTNAGYTPSSFTIEPGRETWVYAIAKEPIGGCASFLTAAAFNLEAPIKQGGNWLGPIQNPTKDFVLTCSMGMLRADIRVKKT